MKVLVLLALIGASLAYTPGMEYQYVYEGRLGMGIPEIKNKISGTGIKALVTLQIQDAETAIIKLSSVHVGEYLGENGLSVSNPIPIQYSPLKGQGEILEEPFKVYLKKNYNEVMVVPKSDLEWIVNLRKSIAQLFLIEPIRGTIQASEIDSKGAFSLYEPTIFGRCSVDYVLRPIQEERETRFQDSSEDEYLLTRAVNFDKCGQDEVALKQTSFKNLTQVTGNLFRGSASRQSVMTAKLIRQQDQFVIKEENVQGYFSVNPFFVPTDKLMSITNQTLILESVKRITTRLDVTKESRVIDTWYMEVASPFSAPRYPIPFVNFYGDKKATYAPLMNINVLTGIPLNPAYIQRFQIIADKLIEKIATLMLTVGPAPTGKIHPFSTHEGQITSMLETATETVRGMDVHTLEQLFEKYYSDKSEIAQMKLKMFIDVCAVSGTNAPMKMLIDQMMKQRITPERITSIFMTISNNFIATPVIPDLLKFVKTLDFEEHPVVLTNVLVNVATILKKVCVTKETIPFQIYGKEQCDESVIVDEFIPLLKHMLEETHVPCRQRVIVQTLVNLEIPQVIDILARIIKQRDYDVTVREVAVLAFKKSLIQKEMKKDEIFDMLMPIVQDTMEDPALRQHAIFVLVTCRPSASWWQRLAVSTWREPSQSVGSFIYYLIKTNYDNTEPLFQQEARIAHFILPLTKPFAPSKTYNTMYSKYNPEIDSSISMFASILKDDVTSLPPRNIYTYLMSKMGGVEIPILEAIFSSNLNSKFESEKSIVPERIQKIVRDIHNRRTEERFQTLMNEKRRSLVECLDSIEPTLTVRLFEHLQFIAALSPKNLPHPFKPESLQLSKFFNPAPMEIFLPTELGIPFIGKLSTPTVQSAEGKIKFDFQGKENPTFLDLIASQKLSVQLMTNYKFATKISSDFKAILPWNEKIISSGVETLKSLNLPLNLRITLETHGNLKNISFDILPTQEKEIAAVHVHTIPYVARRSMWPGQLVTEFENFEPITVQGIEQGIYKNKIVIDKQYTGVDAAILWEGDVPFPFTYGNFLEHLRYPNQLASKIFSPTAKMFATSFVIDFEQSETKAFHPSVAFTLPSFFADEKTTMRTEAQKDAEKLLSMKLSTTGTQSRFYESTYEKKLISSDESVQKFEIQHKYIQQLPHIKPEAYCVQMEVVEPTIYDMKTLIRQLNSHSMDLSFSGKFMSGVTCEEDQLAIVKGMFKVSDKKKTVLIEELQNELKINHESVVNTVVNMDETPLYDQTHITLAYSQNLPAFFTNMTFQAYDEIRGSQYPHIYSNYYNVRNPEGIINLQGDRHLDGTWNLRVELPTEDITMDQFELPLLYKLKFFFFQSQDKTVEPQETLFNKIQRESSSSKSQD